MKSATRSPIIMVVTFVFARMQFNIMEASATRSPCIPWTLPYWSTTAIGSEAGPIFAGTGEVHPGSHLAHHPVV